MKHEIMETNDLAIFGEAVKRVRLKLGFTQNKAAQKAFISLTQLKEIESGKRDARTATICRMAESWGISPAEFYLDFAPKTTKGGSRKK